MPPASCSRAGCARPSPRGPVRSRTFDAFLNPAIAYRLLDEAESAPDGQRKKEMLARAQSLASKAEAVSLSQTP